MNEKILKILIIYKKMTQINKNGYPIDIDNCPDDTNLPLNIEQTTFIQKKYLNLMLKYILLDDVENMKKYLESFSSPYEILMNLDIKYFHSITITSFEILYSVFGTWSSTQMFILIFKFFKLHEKRLNVSNICGNILRDNNFEKQTKIFNVFNENDLFIDSYIKYFLSKTTNYELINIYINSKNSNKKVIDDIPDLPLKLGYIKLEKKCDILEKKCEMLEKEIEMLKLHMLYSPWGDGAKEAKKHFEELSDEQKK
jgi:hypothetical protein